MVEVTFWRPPTFIFNTQYGITARVMVDEEMSLGNDQLRGCDCDLFKLIPTIAYLLFPYVY
jgi:hypothetical protein